MKIISIKIKEIEEMKLKPNRKENREKLKFPIFLKILCFFMALIPKGFIIKRKNGFEFEEVFK